MAMTGLSHGVVEAPSATSALLVVIVDLNPVWWAERSVLLEGESNGSSHSANEISLTTAVDHLIVFLNSYMLLHPTNQLLVLGCINNRSCSLFPPEENPSQQPDVDSRPDGFRTMNHAVQSEIQRLLTQSIEETNIVTEDSRETLFIGALSRAICYIHRIQQEAPKGQSVEGRILVMQAAHDSPAHYMHFINTAFTAQKMNVKIDACVLGDHSTLLQQAVDLTDGIYMKVEHLPGLVQVLNSIFLLEPSERSKFVIPEKVVVDYRAACFCHQKLIEVGFVCSVCLSVFCQFSPLCSTCLSTFKFMTGLKKRKPGDVAPGSPSKRSRLNGNGIPGK